MTPPKSLEWINFSFPKEPSLNKKYDEISRNIKLLKKEKETIINISYLTTLSMLWDNRDLNNLFDWEINLWQEEIMAVYSLIEIVNWNNSFSKIVPPKKMTLSRNRLHQDYNYELNYKKSTNEKMHINSIHSTWTIPFNSTDLIFNYNWDVIENINFKRPIRPNTNALDQKILIERKDGLATKMQIERDFKLDNNITIEYTDFWKPLIIKQTKTWVFPDQIVFEYDENNDLSWIIYVPWMSFKYLKKNWIKSSGVVKWIKIAWSYLSYHQLKSLKWVDVINLTNDNWQILNTKASLKSSNWKYTEWFSELKYDTKWRLEELYLEMQDVWIDSKKTIKLEY